MGSQTSAVLATPPPTAELERLGDEIAELSAHLDAATARLLALIREFDARGGWNTGFRSCAEWLGWRVGLDIGRGSGAGARRAGARDAARSSPRPWPAGSCPMPRSAPSPEWPRRRRKPVSSRWGARGRPRMSSASCAGWRQVDRRAEARKAARQHEGRGLQVYEDDDGMVVVRGRLTPETGALLRRALEAGREVLYPEAGRQPPADAAEPVGKPPTVSQQQADALVLVAESALHHALDPGAPGERYQVVVHVDAAVLADPAQPGESVLEDGAHVSAETSRRLTCDASRTVMRHGKRGHVVAIGARTRTIPPALRRALHHRDRGCRFPGCGVRVAEGHHLHHWAQGGPTKLSNLALLCRRHHRAVHEEGYQVARGPDGTLQFRRPDGRPLPEVPLLRACASGIPSRSLRARHDAEGLRLNARTAHPDWLGERLDLGWAIDVLHPKANRVAARDST